MTTLHYPTSFVRAGIARCDITPPVGIYHRMWGAATHERATGVHRPLLATALALQGQNDSETVILLALDHCLLFPREMQRLRAALSEKAKIPEGKVLITFSHTHGAGFMDPSRADRPGGELIQPYLDELEQRCAELAHQAATGMESAIITYGSGQCALAAQRDFYDEKTGQFVCGLNPSAAADATVLVALVRRPEGQPLASVINYACHPTTLAFQNTLISPDYIGALRETVEHAIPAPCLFLQGASGDLGPRHGFVGDPAVADRNGRQLAFAALAALEALPPPATRFIYQGPVVSGATLGLWDYQPLEETDKKMAGRTAHRSLTVSLPYRPDLPTLEQTRQDLTTWQEKKQQAQQEGDDLAARDAHAMIERHQRMLARLQYLPAGPDFPATVDLLRFGDACWVFLEGELYQWFQTTLRNRFPNTPIMVVTLTNGWRCSYLPTRQTYGQGIYQESIAMLAPGSLETLEDKAAEAITGLFR